MALAFGVRGAWIAVANVAPDEGFLWGMSWYHLIGTRVAVGLGITRPDGTPTAEWLPGYPLLLGGIYAPTSGSVLAAELANAALGGLTPLFVLAIGAVRSGVRWSASAAPVVGPSGGLQLTDALVVGRSLTFREPEPPPARASAGAAAPAQPGRSDRGSSSARPPSPGRRFAR